MWNRQCPTRNNDSETLPMLPDRLSVSPTSIFSLAVPQARLEPAEGPGDALHLIEAIDGQVAEFILAKRKKDVEEDEDFDDEEEEDDDLEDEDDGEDDDFDDEDDEFEEEFGDDELDDDDDDIFYDDDDEE